MGSSPIGGSMAKYTYDIFGMISGVFPDEVETVEDVIQSITAPCPTDSLIPEIVKPERKGRKRGKN